MKRTTSIFSAALICSALAAASPASAQPDNLDPVAVAAASRYALPIAFDGYMRRCSASLQSTGYAKSNAPFLRTKFAEGSDEAWPAAKSALMTMSAGEAGDMSGMLDMLGDDALRPFVDGLVEGLVVQEIKLEDCEVIERGLEILDPLPAENVAALIGFMVEMGQRENAEDDGEARP